MFPGAHHSTRQTQAPADGSRVPASLSLECQCSFLLLSSSSFILTLPPLCLPVLQLPGLLCPRVDELTL